jgi:SAM-dependent methyltransferase
MQVTRCRSCDAPLQTLMVDLGVTPLANRYLSAGELAQHEPSYPLRVFVCDECRLAQLDEIVDAREIFSSDYPYFSSFSDSWLEHARNYTAAVIDRFHLNERSQVVEIASNDGYLLRNFVTRGIPALGVEPAANVAEAARRVGVPTRIAFFNAETAQTMVAEGIGADLIVANNVLAHVPALNDFVAGFRTLLRPDGVVTFEFPHLLRLMAETQFDTIYHEHYSYFSLIAAERLFRRHGLAIFDVQELDTHGGSLRVFVQHAGGPHADTGAPASIRAKEVSAGLGSAEVYNQFRVKVDRVKSDLVAFLSSARKRGATVVGYGAPAKGNTLLNYCGITRELVPATVDRSPHKQNRYLPGTHIPILAPAVLAEMRPDYVLILPWNLRDEIVRQLSSIAEWGGQFLVAIPQLTAYGTFPGFGA